MEAHGRESSANAGKEKWRYYFGRIFYYSLGGLFGVIVWRLCRIAFSNKPVSFLYENLDSAILCIVSFGIAGWIQAYLTWGKKMQ